MIKKFFVENLERIIFILIITFIMFIVFSFHTPLYQSNYYPHILTVQKNYNLNYLDFDSVLIENVHCTFYTNTVKETDLTPNFTASNRIVSDGIVAISLLLKKQFNIRWGDLVCVKEFKRCFEIDDTLSKNTKSLDIFIFTRNKKILLKSRPCTLELIRWRRGNILNESKKSRD